MLLFCNRGQLIHFLALVIFMYLYGIIRFFQPNIYIYFLIPM